MNYASSGNGNSTHLSAELFNSMAGIKLSHVPYKGSAPALTDVISGQVPVMFDTMLSAMPFVRSGRLKALGVTSPVRSPAAPEVPTIAESGLPGYEVSAWNGLLAPAGTPDEVIAKLHAAVVKVARGREFGEQLQKQAMEVDLLGPAEFRGFLASELAKWSTLVKDSGAKLD